MHAKASSAFLRILIAWLVVIFVAQIATADTGCNRKRQPPNQNLFWVCVDPGADCGSGSSCQTVQYGGLVPYSTCECLKTVADPNDFSYGTGGLWNTVVTAGIPGPGAAVTFALADGINDLVIYPNADITAGVIQNAQVFVGTNDFTGSFTIVTDGTPGDSIPAHVTSLSLSMTTFNFEGDPTGTNTIVLAPDGPTATGHYIPAAASYQFDEPVHCLLTNSLAGAADFYFRPILTEASVGKVAGVNPFELFATGSYVPAQPVPATSKSWGSMKSLFR